MLRRIMQLLEQGGVHTIANLAVALDTNEALVEQMIEGLARHGYLVPLEGCSTQCATCPAQGLCQSCVSTQSRLLAFRPCAKA